MFASVFETLHCHSLGKICECSWSTLKKVLANSNAMYFKCHGKYEDQQKKKFKSKFNDDKIKLK